jgi:subfamily B ATP-binding cassette protein MsbA
VIILMAMLVQTAMSVAGPWPLKIILDNAVGSHKLAPWLDDFLRPVLSGGSKMQIAAAAAIAVAIIAVLGAVASYIANYYTTSVGPWVANDLRLKTYQAAVGVERIRGILDADTIIPEHPDAREPQAFAGAIEFDHVGFAYDADSPVLTDVSFHIKAGQMVGVVGPTGCGKSTVVSLIPRFYDPSSGTIKIDGADIREYKFRALRDQIGYVLQETVLFAGSVRDNIAYGAKEVTQEQIVEAAKLANADEFIARMPHGYDTMVGNRGETLSGGQRQRIGIAPAIIRDNPILILDEPTAALDTESESLVMEPLERLMKGRTVITIAHRLSTIRDADKIIVLKGGVVAEEGSHDELLARGGVYAELYQIQFNATPAAQATPAAA